MTERIKQVRGTCSLNINKHISPARLEALQVEHLHKQVETESAGPSNPINLSEPGTWAQLGNMGISPRHAR
jgi:hypothetical protein